MGDPISLEVGEAGLCRTRAGDGDQIALGIREIFGMGLEAGAESAADAVAVVGFFRSAFARNKSGADGGEGRIGQGADNDKPACFRLAGFSDAEEILALIDALFSRETHGCGVPERQEISGAPTLSGRSILSTVLRDVTLEVEFCAFRNQAFAAFLTTAFNDVASSLGGHTGAETVLLFTGTFGGLVSTEAHGSLW